MRQNSFIRILFSIALLGLDQQHAHAVSTERISVLTGGGQAQYSSWMRASEHGAGNATISADGRYVVFYSGSLDFLGQAGNNNLLTVYRHDRWQNETLPASLDPNNNTSDVVSFGLSADGRYVVFSDASETLVSGDTNLVSDIFVHDFKSNSTQRVNLNNGSNTQATLGGFTPAISGDGRWVAFGTNAKLNNYDASRNSRKGNWDIYLRDTIANATYLASGKGLGASFVQADAYSQNPALSTDGRWVAFESPATNLGGNPMRGTLQVYLRDMLTGDIYPVSGSANADSTYPSVSADGRYVSFQTAAFNLTANNSTGGVTNVYVYDRLSTPPANPYTLVNIGWDGNPTTTGGNAGQISQEGRHVVFTTSFIDMTGANSGNYTNALRDLKKAKANVGIFSNNELPAEDVTNQAPSVSATGRFVVFDAVGGDYLTSNLNGFTVDDTNSYYDVFVSDQYYKPTPAVDLGLTLANPSINRALRTLTYSTVIQNHNLSNAANNVEFSAVLPYGAIAGVSNSSNTNLGCPKVKNGLPTKGQSGVLVCRLPSLAAGQKLSFNLVLQMNSWGLLPFPALTPVRVTASIQAAEYDPELLESNRVEKETLYEPLPN